VVREVLRYPHPALKQVARPLDPGELEAAATVTRDLLDTMHAHPGCVGLAAPQIEEGVRIVAVDVTGHPKAASSQGMLVLVNPAIVQARGSEVAREGCLSIPDLTANVKRATEISVEARSPEGDGLEIQSSGFEARCLQHELDHLDGILFLDRVHSLTHDVFPRKQGSAAGPSPGRRTPGGARPEGSGPRP
jgi:peptide deformylase